MTDVTVRQPRGRGNVVILDQLQPKRLLIDWRLVAHNEDLILWTDILFWMVVTIQTPRHIKSICLPGERHLIHPAMTGLTPYSLGNMNAVIEENIVWQVVHAVPLDRLTSQETFSDRRQDGSLIPDLTMAGHTGLCRRKVGK